MSKERSALEKQRKKLKKEESKLRRKFNKYDGRNKNRTKHIGLDNIQEWDPGEGGGLRCGFCGGIGCVIAPGWDHVSFPFGITDIPKEDTR